MALNLRSNIKTLGEIVSGRRAQGSGNVNLTSAEWFDRFRGFRKEHPEYHELRGKRGHDIRPTNAKEGDKSWDAPPPAQPAEPAEAPAAHAAADATLAQIEKMGGKFLAEGGKASWSPSGRQLVFAKMPIRSGLRIYDFEAGTVADFLAPGKDPEWSPGDGRWIAYVCRRGGDGDEEVWLVERTGQGAHKVADGAFPTWPAGARTLFFNSPRDGKLRSVRVDEPNAQPRDVLDLPGTRFSAVSPNTKWVARVVPGRFEVTELATGKIVKAHLLDGALGGFPGWSPDSRFVGFGSWGDDGDHGLWLMDCQTNRLARCIPASCTRPAWSKDGKRVAFDVRGRTEQGIWVIEAARLTQALRDAVETSGPPAEPPRQSQAVPGGDPPRKGPN